MLFSEFRAQFTEIRCRNFLSLARAHVQTTHRQRYLSKWFPLQKESSSSSSFTVSTIMLIVASPLSPRARNASDICSVRSNTVVYSRCLAIDTAVSTVNIPIRPRRRRTHLALVLEHVHQRPSVIVQSAMTPITFSRSTVDSFRNYPTVHPEKSNARNSTRTPAVIHRRHRARTTARRMSIDVCLKRVAKNAYA